MELIGCQLNMTWENKESSHRRIRELFSDAEIKPGSLIVLPEMFSTGFSMNVAAIHDVDSELDLSFLKELATAHESFVIGGLVTKADETLGSNDSVLI